MVTQSAPNWERERVSRNEACRQVPEPLRCPHPKLSAAMRVLLPHLICTYTNKVERMKTVEHETQSTSGRCERKSWTLKTSTTGGVQSVHTYFPDKALKLSSQDVPRGSGEWNAREGVNSEEARKLFRNINNDVQQACSSSPNDTAGAEHEQKRMCLLFSARQREPYVVRHAHGRRLSFEFPTSKRFSERLCKLCAAGAANAKRQIS